jgi:hypothetical protein
VSLVTAKTSDGLDQEFIFRSTYIKFTGFYINNEIVICDYEPESLEKIKDPVYLYRSLNTSTLKPVCNFYIKSANVFKSYAGIPVTVNKKNFLNSKVNILEYDNHDKTKIKKIVKNFRMIFIHEIELKDYSKLNLTKSVSIQYYFNKIINGKLTIDEAISTLVKSVNHSIKSLTKSIDTLNITDTEIELLTYYNSILNFRTNDIISNTYFSKDKIKNLLNINTILKEKFISVDNINEFHKNNLVTINFYKTQLYNMLNTLHFEELSMLNKGSIISSINFNKSDFEILEQLQSLYISVKIKTLGYSSNNINTINKLNIFDIIFSETEFNLFEKVILKVFDDNTSTYTYAAATRRTHTSFKLFKIELWKCDIEKLIILLYMFDNNMKLFYDMIDSFEKKIMSIRNLN